jgi:hypothetical protein
VKTQKMDKPDKKAEIQFMYNWVTTIYAYIASKNPLMKQLEQTFMQSWQKAYDRLMDKYRSVYFQGFKQGFNDITGWAKDLRKEEFAELNEILLVKFGKGFIDAEKELQKTLSGILKRKKIRSETEFYIVNEYLSDTAIVDDRKNELNKIIVGYEKGKL